MIRMSFQTTFVAAFLISMPWRASAQVPGSDTLRLTVAETIARAVSTSPLLARERFEIQRSQAERFSSGAFFPELPELEYRQATDAPFANEGEGTWEVGIAQEIELAGQFFLRREFADRGVAGAELRLRAIELDTRANARIAYADLVAAEARLRLLDTLVEFARRLDTVSARLLAAEEISELERNSIGIERGRSEIELLNAIGNIAVARAELATLVRAEPGVIVSSATTGIDASQMRAVMESADAIEASLAAGDTVVFTRRPDWQALDMARQRAGFARQLGSRQLIPNLRLGLSLESETRPDVTGSSELPVQLRTDRFLGFNVGVKIPLPISGLYDIGQGAIAVADAEIAIAQAEQRVLENRIRSDVARAAARLRPAALALDLYTRTIAPRIARNLELLERGYRAGELSATELITQQLQFARVGEASIEAEREYNKAFAEFERALGQ